MRARIRARLLKAIRRGRRWFPDFPAILRRLAREGLTIDRALYAIVADSDYSLRDRARAARLLQDIAGDPAAFVPVLRELIAAGDPAFIELTEVIEYMWYTDRLTRPALEVLRGVMKIGTLDQRFWVVDKISRFEGFHVRRALLEVLNDSDVPPTVRANAARGLCRYVSQETVRSCIKAASDADAVVRLWAAFTLGEAARWSPVYRDAVIPVLKRMLSDQAVVPHWWSVGREAQLRVAYARGSAAELDRLHAEMEAIRKDPSASLEDRRWASDNE